MLSLTKPHHYYQTFLAQSVGVGIGMGLIFLPSLSIASHYFRAKRSIAMGVVIAGKEAIQSIPLPYSMPVIKFRILTWRCDLADNVKPPLQQCRLWLGRQVSYDFFRLHA